MTPHNNGAEDGILAAAFGWVGAFFGQVALLGIEIGKAAMLGFAGAMAGMYARHLWRKWFPK